LLFEQHIAGSPGQHQKRDHSGQQRRTPAALHQLRGIAVTTDYGTEVQVSEGVEAGDKVVLQPPVNLAEGDKVQITPEPPAAAR
jgi:hypothetical protein